MVQLYDDDTDIIDEEPEESNGHHEEPDYAQIFGAPDYASFIKTPVGQKSRAYERKLQSMVKAGVIGTINAKAYPDAAALLKYGPGFCRAGGELASHDAKAGAIIDMLTAPSNPYALFAVAALPLVGQLLRNHNAEVETAKMNWRTKRAQRKAAKQAGLHIPRPERKPAFTIKLGKLHIPVKVRIPSVLKTFRLSLFMNAQTKHPNALVEEVFSDPKVIEALRRMGARPEPPVNAEPRTDPMFDEAEYEQTQRM